MPRLQPPSPNWKLEQAAVLLQSRAHEFCTEMFYQLKFKILSYDTRDEAAVSSNFT